MTARVSVVIPAHNEERVIARNLAALHAGIEPGALDVVVVCNGCTDDTAVVARQSVPGIRVVEIEHPSKAEAVRVGNLATDIFPRVHLDADVQLTGTDLLALVRPILDEGLLAAAPRRVLLLRRCHWLVRWYYEVWEQLPQVRSGLFGRGVIALSKDGQARVSALPAQLSDDLVASDAFTEAERRVVQEAQAVIVPPSTLRDLLRRRTRVATGNAQASASGLRHPGSATTPASLLRITVGNPGLVARLPVFLSVALVARASSQRALRSGDVTTWLRDESSRA